MLARFLKNKAHLAICATSALGVCSIFKMQQPAPKQSSLTSHGPNAVEFRARPKSNTGRRL